MRTVCRSPGHRADPGYTARPGTRPGRAEEARKRGGNRMVVLAIGPSARKGRHADSNNEQKIRNTAAAVLRPGRPRAEGRQSHRPASGGRAGRVRAGTELEDRTATMARPTRPGRVSAGPAVIR